MTAEERPCQDTERNRSSKAHSRPGHSRERDLSGHGKKPTGGGTLTSWRRQREGLVRTQKKPTDQGTLTFWRRQRVRLVRTHKETDRARHTHFLEMAAGGTCQDTERTGLGEGYSPTGDDRWRDLSGHGKEPTERCTLTNWRQQREGLVRTRNKTDRARPTHFLEAAERGICQDTERNRPNGAHSLSGDSRGRYLSRHGNKPRERGALTSWRGQREGLVGTRKRTDRVRRTHILETVERGTCQDTEETDRAMHTHCLETADGGTCQDTERNRPSKAHSHTGNSRGRDLSGHRKKTTDRGTLTN